MRNVLLGHIAVPRQARAHRKCSLHHYVHGEARQRLETKAQWSLIAVPH
jgi:hypothetical protein